MSKKTTKTHADKRNEREDTMKARRRNDRNKVLHEQLGDDSEPLRFSDANRGMRFVDGLMSRSGVYHAGGYVSLG